LHPFTVPKAMLSSASSHLSMTLGLRGPTLSHATACAAGSHAIGEAAEAIRGGRADIMIAGGSDAAVSYGLMKAWEAMRVLAPGDADPASACRPFSRDRQGLVIGEGAGIVILEEWERARARGAMVRAELAGYGATADAGHITQPGIDAPARAVQQALAQARLPPECIDYVSAHGTGTRVNDPAETTILKQVFGEHAGRLAVSSIKSMIGHTMGASGALGLIAAVLAIRDGVVPPTAHYRQADPECDLDYVPNEARRRRVDRAISNAFAFGGLNAALVVVRA
jgi:nodulation protein E